MITHVCKAENFKFSSMTIYMAYQFEDTDSIKNFFDVTVTTGLDIYSPG